jgi:DNA-binding NarL/FixJ family response regulator
MALKVLLIDDHELIREALRGVLKELKRNATVLEAGSGGQAMQVVDDNPDVNLVLLDLTLPDRDGFSVLTELRERFPAVSVVVLSAAQERSNVVKALELGASGYIPKSAGRDVMLGAMQLVLAGGIYIPPQVLERDTSPEPPPAPTSRQQIELCCSTLGLTERQIDVLELVMQGKNNKTICRALNLAEPTVKNHVTAIIRAFKVTNRTEVVIAVSNFARHSYEGGALRNAR